ncbi:hypothetical protein KBY72_02865 [Cyanobium sp. BA5m-21]|uniref:hypothetical protein n=1 Tax=unclassified Cyanobium TaxID=2627006 RepID=UPI0020CDC8B0|nr:MULTISPECIES: hypothetical protein [unclassified Cyanobium]MCP9902577.1 hypothetical protein [Cyanobium sp. BA5m-10]MCP9906122.1 hypothetical protein [Cyanobium sp. BA5m-21]
MEVRQQGPLVLRIIALVSFANVVFYVLFVYQVDYSAHQAGSSLAQANTTSTVIQTLGLPLVLLGGVLADRWGKLQVNRLGTLLLALVAPIALPVVQLAGPSGLAVGQLLGVLPVMIAMGGQGGAGSGVGVSAAALHCFFDRLQLGDGPICWHRSSGVQLAAGGAGLAVGAGPLLLSVCPAGLVGAEGPRPKALT